MRVPTVKRTLPLVVGLTLVAWLCWPSSEEPLPGPAGTAPGGTASQVQSAHVGLAETTTRTAAAGEMPRVPGTEQALARFTVRATAAHGAPLDGSATVTPDAGEPLASKLHGGEATFEIEPGDVRMVLVAAPGYSRVSRRFASGGAPSTIELRLPAAGCLRVRLIDDAGNPLAGREVETHAEVIAPEVPALDDVETHLHHRSFTTTDERGIAMFADALPGLHRVATSAYAQWREARSDRIAVAAGAASEITLVQVARDSASYAAVAFADTAFAGFELAGGAVRGYQLFHGDGASVRLYRSGPGRVVAIVPGAPGAFLTAFLAACDASGKIAPDGRRSEPMRLAVGATVSCDPRWR